MRSKTLLTANILASLYCIILLWAFIGLNIIDAGGLSIINAIGGFFESAFRFINIDLAVIKYLYVLGILLMIHICLFTAGCIISWIAYAVKKSNVAICAAVVYLIGTLCSPICFIFGIPITILVFIGANNQKKICKKTE